MVKEQALLSSHTQYVSGADVIFFGEDPGVIGDNGDDEDDIRDSNIRRLFR